MKRQANMAGSVAEKLSTPRRAAQFMSGKLIQFGIFGDMTWFMSVPLVNSTVYALKGRELLIVSPFVRQIESHLR